jgi:predicted extracellular nuclease
MSKKTASIIIGLIAIVVTAFLKNKQSASKDTKIVENFDNNLKEEDYTMDTHSTDKKHSKKITIGFYNVENLFDIYDDPQTSDEAFTPNGEQHWTQERYDDKLNKLAEVISEINPVIMGLAEVENFDVINDLIHTSDLKRTNYGIIHAENNDTRGIDVAAIYNKDVFSLSDYNYHRVSGHGNGNTRDILEIKGRFFNQDPVTIFVTHWPSRRKGEDETEHKRIALAKALRQIIDDILDKSTNENIVIMGDFNDEPSNESVHKYLMQDDFYNLHRRYENKNTGTVNHQGEWMVFDQIIVSKSLLNDDTYNISKKNGEIYNEKRVTFTHKDGNSTPSRTYGGPKYYGGYSDHYAVFTDIVVKY